MSGAILPGATLGIFGSGQLGRMFALAARPMGYRVHVFSEERNSPAGQVADREFVENFHDLDAVKEFANSVDVASYEFENVPAEAIATAEEFIPVRPRSGALRVVQNRITEKTALKNAGLPVTPFIPVHSIEDLLTGYTAMARPCILKTARFGYDGKGQAPVTSLGAAPAAWNSLKTDEAILEAQIGFQCEISVVAARSPNGEFLAYPAFENIHAKHILDVTLAPARVSPEILRDADEIARAVFETLDAVGVMCVEFFVTPFDELLINEIAPRPHNSGHLTINAHVTSQFEQQVRSICGLPLGSVQQFRPACMVNLLGHLWDQGDPAWGEAFSDPDVKLHLYGKQEARPGRKMGHLTVLGDNLETAQKKALAARAALVR